MVSAINLLTMGACCFYPQVELANVLLHDEKELGRANRLLIFIVLDTELYSRTASFVDSTHTNHPDLRFKVVDLSAYSHWIQGGTKLDLKEVAKNLRELSGILKAEIGVGDQQCYERERAKLLKEALEKKPHRLRIDLLGHPVRIRFLSCNSFLLDINTVTMVCLFKFI